MTRNQFLRELKTLSVNFKRLVDEQESRDAPKHPEGLGNSLEDRWNRAVQLYHYYGCIEGEQHKQWLLDSILWTMEGEKYPEMVKSIDEHAQGGPGKHPAWSKGTDPS